MFTGIVEEKGYIRSVKKTANSLRLAIEGKKIFEKLHLGDSIAVNGICLTVCDFRGNIFEADIMGETLSRSNLGSVSVGTAVNLERAMAADGRLGGHIVSGHIDGVGSICGLEREGIATWVKISASPEIMRYIVEKGSVAIDGISLTVARTTIDSFSVSLIPHTGRETTLLEKRLGEKVNLENDIVGKYVEKLLLGKGIAQEKKERITLGFLQENGF